VLVTGERVGRNEALFREVNERIRVVGESFGPLRGSSVAGFLCECSRAECHAVMELDLGAYELVRARTNRYLVAPEHVGFSDRERVVMATDRYWVVEKLEAVEDDDEADLDA
jgi:hypothetical protein